MRCRCGNEIKHVPEHLQGLANWVCQQCTNALPHHMPVAADGEPIRRQIAERGKKAA